MAALAETSAEVTWLHGQGTIRVLDREPGSLNAMSNLIPVLKRSRPSRGVARFVAQACTTRADPPFSYFNRGIQAMIAGNFKAASDMFAKEVERAAYYHEFHFWLAMAQIRPGQFAQARKHLNTAMENSPTRSDHDLHAAKLDLITDKMGDGPRIDRGQTRSIQRVN